MDFQLMQHNLSSPYLYHFKRDPTILLEIMKSGFRFNLWAESIPYRKVVQENAIVCFCDIRIADAGAHSECYGRNALVLTKEWGLKNGVSPVRYIHNNSVGVGDNYLHLKRMNRIFRESAGTDIVQYFKELMTFSMQYDAGFLSYDHLSDALVERPGGEAFMESFMNRWNEIKDGMETSDFAFIISIFNSITRRLIEQFNELEFRDSYLRTYSEDFTCPADGVTRSSKVLYDEREWRAVKYLSNLDLRSMDDYYQMIRQRFLNSEYNLLFTDDDVIAILLESEEQVEIVKNTIQSDGTQFRSASTLEKIFLFDQFRE